MAPSAAGTLSGTFPKTTFIMVPLSDEPMFVVSPPEQDFGTVLVSSSAHQNFFIANAGGGTLGINSISITGDDAFTLTDVPDLPASLTTGSTLVFGLDFSPTAAGVHTAQISITDNITREVHTIEITGNGYDATIYSLPFLENWDTATVPNFPLGWSYIHNSTASSSYLRTSTSSPHSAPNCVQMANSNDTSAELILISPIIDNTIDINSIRVKLMMKGDTDHLIQIGTIVDPADPTTFELCEGVTVPTGWAEYTVNLTAHTGTGRYIAIRHGLFSTYDTTYIDDIIFEEIAPNDLAAASITGNTSPNVNTATNYIVNVYNNGTAPQSVYQVQILDDEDTVLASGAGTEVAPGETAGITLSHTFTTEGAHTIKGKVILAGDVNPANDETDLLTISVMEEGLLVAGIGSGTSANTTTGGPAPYGTFYKAFRQQLLYKADDFFAAGAAPGMISALAFNVQDLDTCGPMTNYRIRLKHTDQAALTTTFELGDYTTVWQRNTFMPTLDWNVHNLDTPFMWDGASNLIVEIVTDVIPDAWAHNALVYMSATDYASSLRYQSDSNNGLTGTTGTTSTNRSNIRFYMMIEGMGSLSGTVTAAGSPLADVEISVNDTIFETTTSASGQYNFPFLAEGAHTLTAHKIGYEDEHVNFTIVEDEETIVNISMTESASVNVTGTVTGSDAPSVPLSDVEVTLSGVLNYTAYGNDAGQFTVENVLSGNTYNYVIFRPGYQAATGSITVGSTDYDMGNTILEELTLPPSAITATVNDAETAVNLIWGAPGTPGNFYFFDFENDDGGWVASSNWTGASLPNYPEGDWQWNNTYNAANYNSAGGSDPQNPPQTAYSGTGMWGTNIYGPYTNCAVSGERSYLRQTFDLSTFADPVLNFWHYMDGYNTWDYGEVLVNGNVVWGTSAAAVFMPWQELTIDLSAYENLTDAEISFEWSSTTVVNYAGWYIDDVYIGPAGLLDRSSQFAANPGNFITPIRLPANQLAEERASLNAPKKIADSFRQPMSRPPRRSRQNPSRLPVGYKVWRFEYGQENTPAQWVSLTPAMITDTTFTDPAWPSFPDGVYRWAVKTIYTNDVESNPGFSNTIRKQPNDMSALSI
ncbi:MAG: carboxypeptidase regulatory-like domain-containing protein, partial [Candidatus Cloacimonetes bacterium]|nr:carboxypeptidase regulatory-like domain-containing protein [Candidatus Cloacimonadota bacterium]